jgi:hypothetical protein
MPLNMATEPFVGLRTFVGLDELFFPTTFFVDPGFISFRVPTSLKLLAPVEN